MVACWESATQNRVNGVCVYSKTCWCSWSSKQELSSDYLHSLPMSQSTGSEKVLATPPKPQMIAHSWSVGGLVVFFVPQIYVSPTKCENQLDWTLAAVLVLAMTFTTYANKIDWSVECVILGVSTLSAPLLWMA